MVQPPKVRWSAKKASTPVISAAAVKAYAGSVLTSISSPETSKRIALVERIREGFPFEVVERLAAETGIEVGELVDLGVIPRRTLAHSKAAQQFSPAQSDRATRFFRTFAKAQDTFGTKEKALAWLKRETTPLEGYAPIALLDTEEGARLVEDLLIKIDQGIAA